MTLTACYLHIVAPAKIEVCVQLITISSLSYSHTVLLVFHSELKKLSMLVGPIPAASASGGGGIIQLSVSHGIHY